MNTYSELSNTGERCPTITGEGLSGKDSDDDVGEEHLG